MGASGDSTPIEFSGNFEPQRKARPMRVLCDLELDGAVLRRVGHNDFMELEPGCRLTGVGENMLIAVSPAMLERAAAAIDQIGVMTLTKLTGDVDGVRAINELVEATAWLTRKGSS